MKRAKKIAKASSKSDGGSESPPSYYKYRKPRIWILAADRHIVRLFKKNGQGLDAFGEIKIPPHARKDIAEKTSGHAVILCNKQPSFAHEIIDWLDKAARENAFDRLVLVAAPQTLDALRKILTKSLHTRVVAEVNKNLIKMSSQELQEELAKIVWF